MRLKIKHFSFLALTVVTMACSTTRYLKEGEQVLQRQKIQAPDELAQEDLTTLYLRKANRRLLGVFGSQLVWMYYTGERFFHQEKFITRRDRIEARFQRRIDRDSANSRSVQNLQFRLSKKIDAKTNKIENGNNFMQWGEPLALYDSLIMEQTAQNIGDYLFARGYFNSRVKATPIENNRRVSIVYDVFPGPSFILDSISISCPSPTVSDIVSNSLKDSHLAKGRRFNQDDLSKERERIEIELRNQGYYDFSRQQVTFDADTAFFSNHRMLLRIDIDDEEGGLKPFRVDTVRMVPDVGTEKYYQKERDKYFYRGIQFRYFDRKYHKKVLSQRIFIKRDSLYSRAGTFLTQRQLANLDMFKFVNINYDTSGGQFIANIFASPLEAYSWSNEAGVSVTQGFPGPYVSTNFKRRNLFGGLEILELNGRFGFEGVASATEQSDFYRSTEANINGTITFPQFLVPMSGNRALRLARFNPRSKLLAGYTYTNRPEYQRSIISASSTLTWERSNGLQFSLTATNLNIIRSDTSAAFGSVLRELEDAGNRLINAFKPSFVSNMAMTVTWNQHNYGNTDVNSSFVRASLESGGTSLNIFSPSIIRDWGLEPYKYLRLNVDARRTIIINRHTSLAMRLNTGVGYAYSTNKVLPYEKNFFVGGSNSVRAWRPRRLGPGTLEPRLSTNPESNGLFDYRFEKPGDLLLESSVELRQKLFGFVNYALFLDIGNVWSLQSNTDPSSQFQFNRFFREFGVGTGLGFRFDFTFLIMRFDMGIKVFDPARPAGDRFVLDKMKFSKPFGTGREPVIFNIGIGYPF